jgi:hypothetical protein
VRQTIINSSAAPGAGRPGKRVEMREIKQVGAFIVILGLMMELTYAGLGWWVNSRVDCHKIPPTNEVLPKKCLN